LIHIYAFYTSPWKMPGTEENAWRDTQNDSPYR